MLLLAAAMLLAILVPAVASASGCTDSWETAKSGSWFEKTNWSTGKVPTSTDEVCITVAGTYTVEMTQTTGTVSLKALTIGGTSGTQTVAVGSSSAVNAVLATSEGLTVGAHGALIMTNGDASANSVTLEGAITNSGSVTSELLHGGNRTLTGSFSNNGTLAINTTTAFNGSKAALTNNGAINIAEGKQLTVTNTGSVTNGAGGSITGGSTGDLFASSGTSFTEGAGTTSGTQPVIADDAAISYTGSGASLIRARGQGSTLSGNVAAGQTLSIESTSSENAETKAAASFSNAGTILLTNGDAAANFADLVITAGTLSNSGALDVELAHGGARYLEGNVTNTGTLAINTTTKYAGSKALLTNNGALTVGEGAQLIVSNSGAVINGTGGSIAGGATGSVFIGSGCAFTEGAGTTSGTQPMIVDDGALTYTGSGSSLIRARGQGTTLTGNIASGQTLSIESTSSENAETKATGSFTNAGTILLTNGDTAANFADLVDATGTVANTGTISSEVAHGGPRYLEASVTNTGTISINQTTKYDASSALMTNEGSLKIAEGAQLLVTNKGSVTNGGGGSIAGGATGNLFQTGGTFTQGSGTTSGTQPVIVDDSALVYSGSGSSLIKARGQGTTLTGNIAAGQTLSIESTSSENAETKAAASFTNAGTILLTNGDSAANYADLLITAGTLTNSGTINSELAHGGPRYLEGNVTNTGTIAINETTKYDIGASTLINAGTINIANGMTLQASAHPTISNESGGNIAVTGTGALLQTEGTFNQGLGKTTVSKTSEPVILDRVALHYTDKGVSKITTRGAGTLSGTINKGVTLTLASTCGENSTTTAAGSFLSSGTINLTNVESCANNVDLNLAGGTLENKGTLNVIYPHGGIREIEGSLINEKTVALNNESSQSLKVTGSYTQGTKASLKLTIAGASNFGRLHAGGAVSLGGKLSLKQVKFAGLSGESFAIVTGGSRTGEFASVSGNAIKGGSLHYVPHYTATAANLIVE